MLGSLGVGTTKDRILRSLADIIRFSKEAPFPLREGLCARGRTQRHARNLRLQKQLLASKIRTALNA